jgi:hypothetical protein
LKVENREFAGHFRAIPGILEPIRETILMTYGAFARTGITPAEVLE